MLTTRGVAVCGLAIAAWTLGRFLGVDELYVLGAACVALVVLAVVATHVSSTRIAVRRRTGSRHSHLGAQVGIELALRNDGRLPASLLLVEDLRPPAIASSDGGDSARFVVQGVRPRQVVDLTWPAMGRRRGRYRVGPVRIRLRDPFGLAERSRRYRATDELVVYPAIEDLSTVDARSIRHGADTSSSRRAFHQGDEFYTMRTYVVGDDLRHVHWPSTAHRGTLMIRQHELPWQAQAVVYVDSRAHVHRGVGRRSTFERAVSAAASVLVHLRDQRYELRALSNRGSGPDGPQRLETALVELAELQPVADVSAADTMRALASASAGLLVAVLRPPSDGVELTDDAEVRALQQAGRGYHARVALVIAHDDDDRCATLARLLGLAGWHSAVATPDAPLDEVWRRALIGAAIGRLAGARR